MGSCFGFYCGLSVSTFDIALVASVLALGCFLKAFPNSIEPASSQADLATALASSTITQFVLSEV